MAILKKHIFDKIEFKQVVGAELDDEWFGDKQVGTHETTGAVADYHIELTSALSYLGANCLKVMLEQGYWRHENMVLARSELRTQVFQGYPGVMAGWLSFSFATASINLGDGTAVIAQLWDGDSPSISIRFRYNTGEVFLRRWNNSSSTDHHLFYATVDGSGNPVWNNLDIWYESTESSSDRIKIWVNGVCDPGNNIGVDYTGQIIFTPQKDGSHPYWKVGAYDSSFGQRIGVPAITLYFDAIVFANNNGTEADTLAAINAFRNGTPAPTEPVGKIKHPIAINQKSVCPSDVMNNDNIGKVNFLWTHQKFYNREFGTALNDASYSFSIINSDGTFSIDANTGELTMLESTQFTNTKNIIIRISLSETYYDDINYTIEWLNVNNCIFINPEFEGLSTGSRSAPFKNFKDSGITLSPGQSVLFKRNTIIENDWIRVVSPKINNEYPEWINIAAYGQGIRPVVDGFNNMELSTNHRFITLGDPMNMSGSEPQFAANKIRVFDIETTLSNYTTNDWYPIEGKILGDYWEFHRLKFSKGGLWENGFMWLTGTTEAPVVDRNIILQDIEINDHNFRGIKIETSGVRGYNIRGYNTRSGGGFPISFATKPIGEINYLDAFVTDHGDGGLGIQIRADHVYNFCYIKSAVNALVSFGLTNVYARNGAFKNIIVEDAKDRVLYIHKNSGVTVESDGLILQNIDTINCQGGFDIGAGALNTKLIHVNATGITGTGIIVRSSANGVQLHNITAVDNTTDILIDGPNVEIKNSIYGSLAGSIAPTISQNNSSLLSDFVDRPNKNYRIVEGSSLIGAGQNLGYETDIRGNYLPTLPTLGAYEATIINKYNLILGESAGGGYAVENTTGPYQDGVTVEVEAFANNGYDLKWWALELSPGTVGIVGEGFNVYSFTMPSNDVTITPVFEFTGMAPAGGLLFQGQFLLTS